MNVKLNTDGVTCTQMQLLSPIANSLQKSAMPDTNFRWRRGSAEACFSWERDGSVDRITWSIYESYNGDSSPVLILEAEREPGSIGWMIRKAEIPTALASTLRGSDSDISEVLRYIERELQDNWTLTSAPDDEDD